MTLTPEVEALMIKARHALEVSAKLQTGGDYPDAAGKAYYALFYAAQAAEIGYLRSWRSATN